MNLFSYCSHTFLMGLLVLSVTALGSCTSNSEPYSYDITPVPAQLTPGKGCFAIDNVTPIYIEAPKADRTILSQYISSLAYPLTVTSGLPQGKYIALRQTPAADASTSPEAYSLEVSPSHVQISATGGAGLFYGLQSMLQLITPSHEIPAVSITDEPRFAYRGMMLDVSRHFFSKEFVKKQIDALSYFKINRLHLHLTDAAGWRIEIKKYPRLTNLAAWRTHPNWKVWWNGDRKYAHQSDTAAYGGYYTQDDIRELVAYAQQHYITIIPEIEMPSHSEEVLYAYPELKCEHAGERASDFCVGNEKVFTFLQDVLLEVMELFPSKDIHIGGDEAGKGAWKTCRLCQQRMRKENLKNVDELQSYMIHRMERFLNSHGRNLVGWDEILEGGLAPNAMVMSWRGTEGGLKAVQTGHRAVMSPGEFCYLDGYQDAPHTQPEAIGGYLPLEKVYSYNPVPDTFTPEQEQLLYGVQGNLWTEYVPTPEHAEYMLYPRMIALAEVGWSRQENRSWPQFRQRALKIVDEMQQLGYHPFSLENEFGNRKEVKAPLHHLAYGKQLKYKIDWWKNYPANGNSTLIDGIRGGWNYNDRRWLGFSTKQGMDVTIDLEQLTAVKSIASDFMQVCGAWVFMPAKVTISASEDGENYTVLAEIDHEVTRDKPVYFHNFGWKGDIQCRYIRYQATPNPDFETILFVDEIVVE